MPASRDHRRRSSRASSWRHRFAADAAMAVASVLVLGAVVGKVFFFRTSIPIPARAPEPVTQKDVGAAEEARRRAASAERRRLAEVEQAERVRRDAEEKARIEADERAEKEQAERAHAVQERADGIVARLTGNDRGQVTAAFAEARALISGTELTGEDRERFRERVQSAVLRRRDALVAALRENRGMSGYDDLRKAKDALEKARRSALELINNGTVYTYAPEKEDHGAKAQPEVDRLVAAVRTLWNQRKQRVLRLDPGLRAAIEEVAEAEGAAIEAGGRRGISPGECAQWIGATEKALDLGDFCLDDGEREALAWNRRVRAFNAHPAGDMRPEELKVIELTNDYREMMGRRILEANAALGRAAREHSVRMAAKGDFGHEEADPARKTLDQRVALEGYRGVSGENISLGPSDPRAAFLAWYNSSEHHRNMLDEVYNQMGVGKVRLFWTQDFGHADPESK